MTETRTETLIQPQTQQGQQTVLNSAARTWQPQLSQTRSTSSAPEATEHTHCRSRNRIGNNNARRRQNETVGPAIGQAEQQQPQHPQHRNRQPQPWGQNTNSYSDNSRLPVGHRESVEEVMRDLGQQQRQNQHDPWQNQDPWLSANSGPNSGQEQTMPSAPTLPMNSNSPFRPVNPET